MQNKICSFFGHSSISKEENIEILTRKIETTLINLIEKQDYSIFYFGGFGEFDNLCYKIVTILKQKYPFIKRIYCLEDEKYLNKLKFNLDYNEYEDYIYLPLNFDWWYTRIFYRNCSIVDTSDLIIFYIRNTKNSGAYKTYKYAVKQNKNILKI